MPDGAATPATPAPAHEQDGRLVYRVRWQLIAWSAGSTLAILLVLGVTLYAAVATTLTSASENLLRDRASLLTASAPTVADGAFVQATGTVAALPGQPSGITVVTGTNVAQPGFAIDGPYAGTLAVIIPAPADGVSTTVGSGGLVLGATGAVITAAPGATATIQGVAKATDGGPDPSGYTAALAGATTLRDTTWQGSQVRVLSAPVTGGVVQVIGDRTAEIRTLNVLVIVLLVGGLVALAAAVIFGWLYATRALVPIRASLRRQREFAADTSHELRTPLAVIRASVARVRQQPDACVADVAPALDVVDTEAVRLAALVDDLLALARTDAGSADLELASVDLADVASDGLAVLEPLAASRGVGLVLDVEPAPGTGDAVRLRRLVTVLADNAIRHGREGGAVTVTVRPGRLVVDDDGPGIPVADRSRVFDRFWRGATAAPGGSGLGLAIAAWIAERHGGRIEAGESPAGGARFSVVLPGFTRTS